MLARLAEAGGLELRIFDRDGRRSAARRGPIRSISPNADLVNAFLRERDGQTFQSVPVAAFFTRDFEYLYHYTEFPRIYHKERLAGAMQRPRPGRDQGRSLAALHPRLGRPPAVTLLVDVGVDGIDEIPVRIARTAAPQGDDSWRCVSWAAAGSRSPPSVWAAIPSGGPPTRRLRGGAGRLHGGRW